MRHTDRYTCWDVARRLDSAHRGCGVAHRTIGAALRHSVQYDKSFCWNIESYRAQGNHLRFAVTLRPDGSTSYIEPERWSSLNDYEEEMKR